MTVNQQFCQMTRYNCIFTITSIQFFMKKLILLSICCTPLMFAGCGKKENGGGGGFNIFSVEDDKNLGLQVKQEIASDPAEFPILDPATNTAAYNYIYQMRDEILASGAVTYKDEFPWELYIVKRDDIQNAFCTPGGYIYIYTGLIKYLDDKSSLAGVLGHEMAHADKRHSTDQLTKAYGIQTLLDIALGNDQGLVTQVASQLVTLSFSRSDEKEADEFSVKYLCPTKYQADGGANFFQKITDQGSAAPPEFLSTHPNPDNRVQDIQSQAQQLGCSTTISQDEEVSSYAEFKAML